jgi:hypothetical protein
MSLLLFFLIDYKLSCQKNVVVVVKTDVKQIDVHAERLDKCAIVDAIQILLVKINECIYMYHFFFVKCFM